MMIKLVLPLFFPLLFVLICCTTDDAAKSAPIKVVAGQTGNIERFKLLPTQNMWTFIKLDTQTGQMWQIQYSVKDDKDRIEYDLNPNPLIHSGQNVNGRFELYPTHNIYNFILIDRINGKTWQVQWSLEDDNRVVVPINHANLRVN